MNQYLTKGESVRWDDGLGIVTATYPHSVTKWIGGTQITRSGRPDNKALLIQQHDGKQVLRLESEVRTGK